MYTNLASARARLAILMVLVFLGFGWSGTSAAKTPSAGSDTDSYSVNRQAYLKEISNALEPVVKSRDAKTKSLQDDADPFLMSWHGWSYVTAAFGFLAGAIAAPVAAGIWSAATAGCVKIDAENSSVKRLNDFIALMDAHKIKINAQIDKIKDINTFLDDMTKAKGIALTEIQSMEIDIQQN